MPFDGSGNYSRVHDWTTDRDNNIKIQASRMDEEFDDIASSLNSVFFRNGLVPMTGDLDMGANDISDIAAGTAAAPSFSFFGDPNSGMYLAGVNSLGFTTNGVKRVGITNAGLDITGALTVNGSTVWNAANDGAGSGLDADLLDGLNSTAFAILANSNTFTGAVDFNSATRVTGNVAPASGQGLEFAYDSGGNVAYINSYSRTAAAFRAMAIQASSINLFANAGVNSVSVNSNTVWHAGNDGSGSGLDADLLDGVQGSGYALLAGATFTGPVSAQKLTSTGAAEALRMADATPFISYYNNAQTTRFGYFQHDGTNFQLANEVSGGNFSIATTGAGVFTFNAATVWHASNDGSGSGLDADLLDGVQGSGYAQLASANTFTGVQTVSGIGAIFKINGNASDARIEMQYSGAATGGLGVDSGGVGVTLYSSFGKTITISANTAAVALSGTAITFGGNTVWHAGNDGAGSGLDADLLDGVQGSGYALLAGATFTGNVGVGGAASVFPFEIHGASANFAIRSTDTGQAALRAYVNGVEAGKISWSGSNVFFENVGVERFRLTSTGALINGSSTVWHAGNDGAGSGLDADLLDGIESRTIRGIERSTASIDTSLVGKCKAISAGVTVPASTFAAGDSFALYNDSAAAVTITQGSGLTQRLNGTATTGNLTLAARGFATIWFNSATEAVVSGAVS